MSQINHEASENVAKKELEMRELHLFAFDNYNNSWKIE